MKRIGQKQLSLLLCLVLLFTMAIPAGARASDYFHRTNISATAGGGGTLWIKLNIAASGTMQELGATEIIVHERQANGTYKPVRTFTRRDRGGLRPERAGGGLRLSPLPHQRAVRRTAMNRDEIKTILPHRDSMLLLDQLDREGEIAHGQYRVKGDEWFLQGHFPDAPVVPGVILCEILAQSAGILMQDSLTEDTIPMYTSMKNVRFRAPVLPGDLFETKCRITRAKHPFYFAEGEGYVGDTLCVKAEFSFGITEREVCFQRS